MKQAPSDLGYDKVLAALETIAYFEPRPTWLERLRRWAVRVQAAGRTPPPKPYLLLTVVGARGHESAQAQIPRTGAFWRVEKGRASNAAAIILGPTQSNGVPCGSHWLLADEQGRIVFEGRFRRAVLGAEIPTGWLVVRD